MSIKYESGEQVEMVIKTVKESQSGLFTNERLLLIKAGIVSYFSSIPKQFIGNYRTIQMSGQIPKFTIAANEISKVQLKGNELSLLVHKSKLIPRDDFQKLVKGNENVLKDRNSKQYNLDHNGYQLWIFKSQEQESLLQFYRLVNLFRTGDPKFQPQLSSVIEGFQKKKAPRKTTIDPSQTARTNQLARNRLSEFAKPNTHFQVQQKSEEFPIIVPKIEPHVKIQPVTNQQQFPLEQPKRQIKEEDERQRLKEVVEKIVNINQPILQQIDERTNEDQYSCLSKDRLIPIEVIKTFEEDYIIQPQKQHRVDEVELETSRECQQKEVANEVIDDLISKIQKLPAKQLKKDEPKLQLERSRHKQIQQMLYNSRIYDAQVRAGFEVREQKKRKINHLLKVASLTANYDIESVARTVGMSLQQLKQFIRINSIEEPSSWNFIENQLAKNLSGTIERADYQTQIESVTDELIPNYHKIQQLSAKIQPRQMLEGELTVDNYEYQHEQEKQVLKWMEDQINCLTQNHFSSKIISNYQYKIAIRPLVFNKDQILCVEGSWIVNSGGHLEQFLAYLHLERTVRELNAKSKSSIRLECGDAIFLKYRDHQAIVKQLRVGYSYYPLKSIRALEFLTKSKDIKKFYQAYPQFLICVQMIKEGLIYRLHLDRIPSSLPNPNSIKLELKRLVFPFDNELDLFFQSPQFVQLQHKCIEHIHRARQSHRQITEGLVFQLLEQMDSNLEVDIICKFLGARIDKKMDIQFQSTVLRLGNRQFGEQLSLIRRARKSGDLQFSRNLSKKVMSRLQYYKWVTPVSNFIQIYLQLIDFMVIEKGQLHRAVSVLLKVVNVLSQFEIQQYPVYLALMKTFLKLGQIDNFITVLENSRLFLSQMFRQRAVIFDFPFVRVLMMLTVRSNPQKGLEIIQRLIHRLDNNPSISEQIRQRYISRAIWDRCNILLILNQHSQAFLQCEKNLLVLEQNQRFSQNCWSEGVLCLGKCWCEREDTNAKTAAMLQKRVQKAIEQSLTRQNFEMTFMLLQIGEKILQKCKEQKLPKMLELSPSFQQARIEFNTTRQEMLGLIQDKD